MKGRKPTSDFRIRRIVATDHGISYQTFQVVGYLNGERIRKKFRSREDALGEVNRLAVLSANSGGIAIRPVNTPLMPELVRAAELAIERLGEHQLKDASTGFSPTTAHRWSPARAKTPPQSSCAIAKGR